MVDDAALAVLDVDPVPADVPGGQVRRAETVAAVPVERVRVDDEAVLPRPAAVEHDPVAVDAADRDVALAARDDVAAGVGARVEQDRVAAARRGDRRLHRRRVLWHADHRSRRRRRGRRRQRQREQRHRRRPHRHRYACEGNPRRTSNRVNAGVDRYQPPCVRRPSQNRCVARMYVSGAGFANG